MNDLFSPMPGWDHDLKWERLVQCAGTLFSEGLIDAEACTKICEGIYDLMTKPRNPQSTLTALDELIQIKQGDHA